MRETLLVAGTAKVRALSFVAVVGGVLGMVGCENVERPASEVEPTDEVVVSLQEYLADDLLTWNNGRPWMAKDRETQGPDTFGKGGVFTERAFITYSDLANLHIVAIGRLRGSAEDAESLVNDGVMRPDNDNGTWAKKMTGGADIIGCERVTRWEGMARGGGELKPEGVTSCVVEGGELHIVVLSAGSLTNGIEGVKASDTVTKEVLNAIMGT